MTAIYNLRASSNATFRWTRDLTALAAVYDLAAATIRMQARTSPYAPDPPAYEWNSANTAHGQVSFNATTSLAVFEAPLADVSGIPGELAAPAGELVHDCRRKDWHAMTAALVQGKSNKFKELKMRILHLFFAAPAGGDPRGQCAFSGKTCITAGAALKDANALAVVSTIVAMLHSG
jgi:hypothetical protein